MLGLLSESEDYQILLFIICTNLNFRSLIDFLFKCCQILTIYIYCYIYLHILYCSYSSRVHFKPCWKIEFNPDLSKQATEVLFSRKNVSPKHPRLIFNGINVKKVDEQKHLGLILDSDLSFKKHLDEKI